MFKGFLGGRFFIPTPVPGGNLPRYANAVRGI